MDWLSENITIPLFVVILGGLVVALITGLFKIAVGKEFWNRITSQVRAWYDRVTLYSRLTAYDRDILKALHDSDVTLISLRYNDGRPVSIQAKLDHILGIPVACRLIASHHYNESLKRLTEHNLLKGDMRRIYEKPNPDSITTQSYELTIDGHEFIRKHARGLDWRERFIRKWFRGLGKHKYTGCYRDDIGEDKRRQLPKFLQGDVTLKKHFVKPMPRLIGSNRDNVKPDIYECAHGYHEDGVEWLVAVPSLRVGDQYFDVVQHEDVILWIHTDKSIRKSIRNREIHDAAMWRRLTEQSIAIPANSSGKPVISAEKPRAYRPSNKPRRPEFSQKYGIQAKVIAIEEGDDPVVTILKLGESKVFDPSEVF